MKKKFLIVGILFLVNSCKNDTINIPLENINEVKAQYTYAESPYDIIGVKEVELQEDHKKHKYIINYSYQNVPQFLEIFFNYEVIGNGIRARRAPYALTLNNKYYKIPEDAEDDTISNIKFRKELSRMLFADFHYFAIVNKKNYDAEVFFNAKDLVMSGTITGANNFPYNGDNFKSAIHEVYWK